MVYLLAPPSGFYRTIFAPAYVIALLPGLYESTVAYYEILDAQAPSVRRVRNFMTVGWVLIAMSFAESILSSMVSRAFSIETPFHEMFVCVGAGAFLVSTLLLGGGSLVAWQRWAFAGSEDLDIRYWTRPSRRETVRLLGLMGLFSGFVLSVPFATAGLVLFIASSVIVGVLTVARMASQKQHGVGPQVSFEKVELRMVSREERISVGRQISELVRRKYGRRVLAVCIWGATARTPDRPHSGLDLLVVVRDGVRLPSESYVFNGLPVQISYWQEIGILNRARMFDEDWPWYTGHYRNRIVLFERKAWCRHLDKALEQSDKADSTEAIRDVAFSLIDHFGDLRDDQLESDAAEVMNSSMHIAWDAVKLVFLVNRAYWKKGWKDVFECPVKPSDFRHLVETAMGITSASREEMIRAAEKLFEEGLEMVRSRGIGTDTSQLRV